MRSTRVVYGYARVSTGDQDTAIQNAALRAAGCIANLVEKVTGATTTAGRDELCRALSVLGAGDILVGGRSPSPFSTFCRRHAAASVTVELCSLR
ncbi:hypothetical protein EYW49_08990 [Siculibacillus lacustris]|uniref:Resolvase/invertase-type recombinase catalytic domain-containing protein n=1 Tax=Siculibacillus lacustris TaxID=1549641 RepID=A0A4Q9VRH8_9HYPH|nr:recombinase family protein [Siculibacillus lacustris]TBW38498.1 hypothetical protein EYW49_08990 [Siculibacillus lacustris]